MKRIVPVLAAALLGFSLVSCGSTDIVAKVANSSFKSVIDASKDRVSYSEKDSAWVLSSEAGDKILFSTDFSANDGSGSSPDMNKPDVEFSLDAAPFIAAGLDPAKVQGWIFAKVESKDAKGKTLVEGKLLRPFDLE
jgi:hypothetical protein